VQRAVIVRNIVEDPAGQGVSYEVDASQSPLRAPLRTLLAEGWRVVHTCPLPSELDCCCLVIVEKRDESAAGEPAAAAHDMAVADLAGQGAPGMQMHHLRPWTRGTPDEPIPLHVFGVEPAPPKPA
jgi:hypothetical protein